jgi:flagellar motor switch protein FliN/FliY
MTIDPKKLRDAANMEVLMHVPLQVTAELGTSQMSVSEVLKLGTGSIIELERLAGGPVDLLVNDKLIARGEVVAVDENFGVRITELIQRPG